MAELLKQRALSFLGGSLLVTPTHVELVMREDDLRYADDNADYRVLVIPESEREELAKFLLNTRARSGEHPPISRVDEPTEEME